MISFRSRALPLLNVLSDEDLGEIMKHAHVKTHAKNSLLFSDATAHDHVYFVMSGWVGLFADSADGAQAIVDVITAGGMVGDHLIHGKSDEDLYSMVISQEASLLEIPLHVVQYHARRNAHFSFELFRFMSEQALQMRKHICQINCMPVAHRILMFLLRFAGDGQKHFLLPFNRTLMAAYLGMKRETFSRAQKELEKSGVFIHGNRVTIEDLSLIPEDILLATLGDASTGFGGKEAHPVPSSSVSHAAQA